MDYSTSYDRGAMSRSVLSDSVIEVSSHRKTTNHRYYGEHTIHLYLLPKGCIEKKSCLLRLRHVMCYFARFRH